MPELPVSDTTTRRSATPLLTAKLRIPHARPDRLLRPDLVDRLNEGRQCKLILVSAPAGYGKTTLLSGWALQSRTPAAWVALDAGDNEPSRFWTYFVAALQTLYADFGEWAIAALRSPVSTISENLLDGLIGEIADLPRPLVLILDDIHTITNSAIHGQITFLLENLSPHLQLLIAGRADPPWPLGRLRARRELMELRLHDLRFTEKEATKFLREVMCLDLDSDGIAMLQRRTEGWVVGLQMAALALQRSATVVPGATKVTGAAEAFTGNHRFVLDYLVEEVLVGQTCQTQDFLLRTSILESMCGSLCDAVGGYGDSQAILAELERANLFIVPLDDERCWYRYHQLFGDALCSLLERTRPAETSGLHRRASEWYASQGRITEAVGHALASGDADWLEHLVAVNALATIYQGELATVLRWLDALPEALVRSRPRLCVMYAWVLAYAGRLEAIEVYLGHAERVLAGPDRRSTQMAENNAIMGHIAGIRAYAVLLSGDAPRAVALALEGLCSFPETELLVRGWTLLVLGCAQRSTEDLTAAAQTLSEAYAVSRAVGDIHLQMDVLWEQATLLAWQGRLHEVMRICETVLQRTGRSELTGALRLPVMGYLTTLMSYVLYEWDDLEAAERYAREGLDLCRWWGQADALVQAYFYLARTLSARGQVAEALLALRKARQVARDLGPWYVITAGAHEARIRLAQGDLPAAIRWVQESELDNRALPLVEYGIAYRVLARVLASEGRFEEALALLTRLRRRAESAGAGGLVISALALESLVLQAQGETSAALAALDRALELAEPEGYIQVFIGEGMQMERLLRAASARGSRRPYVIKLLAALARRAPSTPRTLPPAVMPLTEPLSERELEVIRLLAAHLSGSEIAQELFIAENTVRSHIKNLYGKLDVHKRREAIARARDLGLL